MRLGTITPLLIEHLVRISYSRCSSFIADRCSCPSLSSGFSAAQRQMKALSELFFSGGFLTARPSSSLGSRFFSQVLRGFHSSLSFDDYTPCACPEGASSKLLLSIAAHASLYAFHSGFKHTEAFRKAGVNTFLWRIFDTNGVPAARTCAFTLFGAAGISQHDHSLLINAPRASPRFIASSSFAAAHISRLSFSLSCWRTEASEHRCPFSGFPTWRTFSTACLTIA